ncbi:G-type lectin S-receptor-like serine/threonine-protein kinase At4g27290 [Gastrolobium bilobum]|uniref:G-type lectin S-receptor-like serine/threonine-protein kinase At4g27290 n=1 Tax=Gastrolobium bilobum TaxID=150636 RepID=UPI002AB06DA3|nr:G-type lectin S-receptor-like serine/threonine-protein kinase At4g27290 [Gastrolobium bilobum]
MAILPFMLVIANLLLFVSQISSETDTITQFQSLPDGSSLVSQDGTFEFGFFSPGSSKNRYVGIWFKNISVQTVVWVANRDNPIKDNSSKLSISKEGNLVLLSKNGTVHWSTNATTKGLSVIAQLLGSGNLVLKDEKDNSPQNYLWQSFDYPSDTCLPGMKLGWNLTSGLNRRLTAWKNWDDPSSGELNYGLSLSNNPDLEIWNRSSMIYRSGPWNGIRFSGTKTAKQLQLFNVDFVSKSDEYYFSYKPRYDQSLITRIVINQTTFSLQRFTWNETNQKWMQYLNVPRDDCDNYKRCGSFGNCKMTDKSPICECLQGFKAKWPQNWSEGCVRSETWSCRDKNKDGFTKFNNLKVPDTKKSWLDRRMTLEQCKARCWESCNCTAYANSDITGEGSGCVLWFGDLLDLRQLPDAGQDLYVRLAPSEIGIIKTKVKKNESKEDMELPLFDIDTIACATDDFSSDKKLGEGGFGPVYRGTLPDGQDVAVKRLSQKSTQGLKEFKNEVIFCSKLQHRNLVKVLGYCVEEQEKLLIYEYMPNKSLDFFLFDSSRSELLDWSKRFNIITGIARGLLYLHQDSRLRIIHRDLKASNILLDSDMNPKISDFGLARMCEDDQIEGTTSRVIGTYGYMAPEYAIDGIFSIKSDVFSFGILLLEVLSGKKNKGFSYSNHTYNLIAHAWRLWKDSIPPEFIDTCLGGSYFTSEAVRCIHIGLLCVQYLPEDRPNMTTVVVMLTSESALPQPKEPVFLMEKVTVEEKYSYGLKTYCSTNQVSISEFEPRLGTIEVILKNQASE